MECITPTQVSHLAFKLQPATGEAEGADVVAVEVAEVGAGVGAGGAPTWSGQHCIARQQGNIHATSFGTKQQVA